MEGDKNSYLKINLDEMSISLFLRKLQKIYEDAILILNAVILFIH